jgi:3-hydroxyisobutyrate dehydrogenase-like beta-hydroxyacid dehydrogenase
MPPFDRLALIGFGEAARAFASAFADPRPSLHAYDLKTDTSATRDAMQAAFAAHAIAGAKTSAEALAGAQAALCLVTADRALDAARAAAPHLPPGAWWFDGNSCAPQTKAGAAEVIAAGGGRYIDMAIMAPVHPKGIAVPVLLSGPGAEEAAALLRRLGFSPQPVGEHIGAASAIKMIRSVMVKGMEALSAECFLAARRAGVDAQVLASLSASDPALDWPARGAYNLERMMVHGARRAAEMREVVRTLEGLGLPAGMSAACVDWQDAIATLALPAGAPELQARVDRILSALGLDETAPPAPDAASTASRGR